MRQFWIVPVVFFALLVPVAVLAGSGEGGFNGVVSTIEGRYHVHATRIPFLGLISLVASHATQQGVSNLHVAEIEHFSEPIDGDELNRVVEEKLGPGWERMIRETRRKGSEQTLIFVRPEGNRMGLFILDKNDREMDVVEVSVDPDHLSQTISEHRRKHDDNSKNRDADSDADTDKDGGD
jgi:hypothetical protein